MNSAEGSYNISSLEGGKTPILELLFYLWKVIELPLRFPVMVGLFSLLATLFDFVTISLMAPFLHAFMNSGVGHQLAETPIGFLMPLFTDMAPDTSVRLLIFLLIATTLIRVALSYAATSSNFRFQVEVETAFRKTLFQRAITLGMEAFGKTRLSDILVILNIHPNSVAFFLFSSVNIIPAVLSFVLLTSVVFLVSWKLTLIGMALFAISNYLMQRLNQKLRENAREHNVKIADLQHIVMESMNGVSVVQSFVREDWAQRRHDAVLADYVLITARRMRLRALSQPIHSLIGTFSLSIILLVGTYVLSVDGKVWSEMIVLYMLVMTRLAGPISTLQRLRTDIITQIPGVELVSRFLKLTERPRLVDGKTQFTELTTGIQIKNVTFSYPGSEMPTLADLNLTIPKGKTIALVGASGSGKSTLAKLLARFYDVSEGEILIDGVDLRTLNLNFWRRAIGIVSQNTFLFNDTVRENIRFGRLGASDQEVEEVAKQAHAHEFIMETERGYETLVGDRGIRLSGGQAQRIAIARAMLANPKILILDEATSSLDTISERYVQEALQLLSQNRTSLVIAHRLSTIQNADAIFVLENGRIVEHGTYAELMARRGAFWNYAHVQQNSPGSSKPEIPGGRAEEPAPARPDDK